jgi:16S rRNA (guanine966-N2)-methyltransferase
MRLRVTGGELAGRRLRSVRSGLRPTSDRVREALFARLGALSGVRVLDLYAGTGALGIEALSRGARSAVFVESEGRTRAVLRGNLEELGLAAVARVVSGDAPRAVATLGRTGARFDLVLIDPPYASGEVPRALAALVGAGVLAPEATVVVEHGRRHPVAPVDGLAPNDERRYGDTVLTWFARAPRDEEAGGSGTR